MAPPRDDEASFRWFLAAAEAGFPQAMHNVASRFDTGRGVEQDKKSAAAWYRKAANHEVARSQADLGLMLVTGEGIERNEQEGFELILRAAEYGIPQAQQSASVLFRDGTGTQRDLNEAYRWLLILQRSRNVPTEWFGGLAARMSTNEVDAAQQAARDWRPLPEEDPLK